MQAKNAKGMFIPIGVNREYFKHKFYLLSALDGEISPLDDWEYADELSNGRLFNEFELVEVKNPHTNKFGDHENEIQ